MALTETITWTAVAERLPDAQRTVLCSAEEAGVFEGFLDGEGWHDVTAMPVYDVTHWAEMPKGPTA